ncbi:MAG: membrane protein insertion efficiency factor YidD [Clostridia bacterium]|nr:membrane protein insertion efficiency factor YidD [Clostridia bacterium]
MRKVCYLLILFYKKFISPITGHNCIYTPTCSMYTMDAIREYGVILGIIKGAWRILRCNPFAKGGFDPVKPNLRGDIKWML